MGRWSQHFLLLSVSFIQMMKKSWQMPAGLSLISLMVQMTKSKLLLRQAFVHDLFSSSCEYFTFCWSPCIILYPLMCDICQLIWNICLLFQTSISFGAYSCSSHSWKYCDRRWYSDSGKSFSILFLTFTLFATCDLIFKLMWRQLP